MIISTCRLPGCGDSDPSKQGGEGEGEGGGEGDGHQPGLPDLPRRGAGLRPVWDRVRGRASHLESLRRHQGDRQDEVPNQAGGRAEE